MARVLTEELMVESVSRYCAFYKASNGKWYMDLAPHEYGDYEDATTYGPFRDEDSAMRYLQNFANPGGYDTDDSGTTAPPTQSPNGGKVQSPSSGGLGDGGRYGLRGYGY